ncbi:MAG: ABC transporter substrate-binding protein [Gemmatimonadetes bacterium]|nr:ABC transporter substrate-binding protein [Gemmatimonadota bacterium]
MKRSVRIPVTFGALGLILGSVGLSLRAQDAAVDIVFASGPDDSGTVQRLVDAFNDIHDGEIRVEWRAMPAENDAHREALLADLDANPGGIDLMASDVVWTAELARSGAVEDLTDRFYDDLDRESLLAEPLRSALYRLRIWGVPWYTDAGLLFYRRDQLAASGFTAPPTTWDELGTMARQVMDDSGTAHGFVFQGADYEGGTVSAAEFIWSAGGDVMSSRVAVTGLVVTSVTEVDSISVGSEAAAAGLDIARGLIVDGVSPAEVVDFREEQALDAFASGDAVFLRGWPYAYRVLRDAGFEPDQIGVAPLPAAAGGESASCLGGFNLMVNSRSTDAEQEAAWTLLRYLASPLQQRRQALEAGLLPVLGDLYDDPELVAEVPVLGVGKAVFESQLHTRPMSPFYNLVSERIAAAFGRTLRGELTGAQAAELLEDELRAIVVRNR